MKILIGNYGGEIYTWKDAVYDGRSFFVEKNPIIETEIISVHDDARVNMVKCSNCGEVFKADSPELEAHRHLAENSDSCLKCEVMRCNDGRIIFKEFDKTEDGKYIRTTKSIVTPKCCHGWNYINIDSIEARRNCKYRRCAIAEMVPFTDFFISYPEAFGDLITVDKIIEKGYKEKEIRTGISEYTLKARNNIKAIVNGLGIVDYFYVKYYSNGFKLRYSKKYDKLFWMHNGHYNEFEYYSIPSNTREYIKKTIAKLYN